MYTDGVLSGMKTSPPITVREVLSRLDKVQKSGDGWVACCPAHDDSTPSMSVSEGRDGRVVFHCHTGCTFDAIAAALDLPPSALMGAAAAPPRNGSGHSASDRKPPSEKYYYEDEEGAILFRVDRFYIKKDGAWKKEFRQFKRNADGTYAKTRADARLVPYNLPAVLAAVRAGETVYVVEGEKDVHTLKDLGLVATCNPGGAGKWDATFGRYLRDADVVVLPDNDDPGRSHAADVASSARAFAASVTLVQLPGLPHKGDATDWVRMGGDAAALASLVDRQRAEPEPDVETRLVRRPLVNLQPVDERAISRLPMLLRNLCSHYPPGIERTVALTSGLAVLSGLFNKVRVEHYDKDYGLHLMFCLVARSGGGKGILDSVQRMVMGVDYHIRQDGKREQTEWDRCASSLKRGQKMEDARPFDRMYVIPANASKAYALKAAEACGETACIVETEIDTFADASAQEWGDFTDYIRKAFHHETYRQGRIGAGTGETLIIDRPSLAMGISGTWDQFARLYRPNLDNGFYNRFCFVVSNAGSGFRSQRPTPHTRAREAWMRKARTYVMELHDEFAARRSPLVVQLTDEAWDKIDAVFEPEYSAAMSSPIADRLLPFVQRVNLMAVRLMGILSALRAYEGNMGVARDDLQNIGVNEIDVDLALHIAGVWFSHGRALLTQLSPDVEESSPLVQMSENAQAVFSGLPDVFKIADAYAIGKDVGVSERTVKQYMSSFQEAQLVSRDGHTYRKAAMDVVTPFRVDETEGEA